MSIYPRIEYEMNQADLDELLESMKPVPYMVIGGVPPRSQQENANQAWRRLGEKMGFDSSTVKPVSGKSSRFFTAIPSETETQRNEREAKEHENKRISKINELKEVISKANEEISKLEDV